AQTYCGMGQVNFNLKNYDRALEAYQKAIAVITASPRAMGIGYILNRARLGLAKCYHQLGITRDARTQFEAAVPLFTQKQGYNFNMIWEGNDAHMFYDAANYHAFANHPQEALEYLQKAIQCGWADLSTLESDDSFALVQDKSKFQKIVQDLKSRKPLP
ncbi:MAG: tetratricopeptide repeat protein, partial [bacterium]|nr:tetratricopeptide repeat protein [bacterium]